ncbi:glycogen-binding subunit 76A-like [Dermacentor albipictus]|uniref:glycogen-binding subunit 76A-like n=1 Tax=Dermacentor albipictus TaxID=60249 RepID=UPI0038FBFCA6
MTPSEWQSSCAIGLASCRLRAEYLARQLYCKPFTSMDDQPAAVVRCPPCRQQSQSSTSVNGSTGSWPPSTAAPQDASNFLVRTGRALYDRLFSLLQDQATDCVVQYCEQGSNADDPSPSSSVDEATDAQASEKTVPPAADSCGQEDLVVVEEPRSVTPPERLPQSAAVAPDAVLCVARELEVKSAGNVKGDAEEEPRRYPAERDVVRAALAHRPLDDGFRFPIVQELVRPGVLVHNESDSSCDLSDDAFHDAADGLAEEFRDGSGSSENSNEEKALAAQNASGRTAAPANPTTTDATTTDTATVTATIASPDAVSSPPAISSVAVSPDVGSLSVSGSSTPGASPSRPRSSRFAKHRFTEAPPRKVTPKAPQVPEHPSDESSSSDTISPVADTQMLPATPPKRDSADSDDDEAGRAVLVRSTSLKSGKSPPGTPFKKKIVRFADALGLDLAAVRTIVSEELPLVPASAFTHLQLGPLVRSPPPCTLELKALFPQPGASPTFMTRLTSQRVCLESVVSSGCALHAVIRVLNVAFEKLVVLRYSLDNWRSFCDLRAVYLPGSSDGISDRFGVDVYLTPQGDAQLQMCVRYVVGDQEYWDNNEGANYCFEFRDSPKDEPEVTPLMNYL